MQLNFIKLASIVMFLSMSCILLAFFRYNDSVKVIEGYYDQKQRKKKIAKIAQHRKRTLFIGIKSAPEKKYRIRRDAWRKSKCAQIYKNHGVTYKFIIGLPIDPNKNLQKHNQASKPTEIEIREQAYLKREILTYNDIHIAPFRDQYLDISNKLISLLRFGYYQTEAEYIAEHDDEYCLNVKTALGIIRQHELYDNSKELYAGTNLFRGDEYLSMQGTNGLIAPYFSGWCSFFSRNLVKAIAVDNYFETVLSAGYGTDMDDANTGKWVYLAELKFDLEIEYIQNRSLVLFIDRLGCNTPLNYADGFCDDDNNAGDCSWDGGDCCKSSSNPRQFKYCDECECKDPLHKLCSSICWNTTYVADGYCDDGNNFCGCNWDGGDCCSNTAKLAECFMCTCHKNLSISDTSWKTLSVDKKMTYALDLCEVVSPPPPTCESTAIKTPSPAYQIGNGICRSLGSLSASSWDILDKNYPERGVTLKYSGGELCPETHVKREIHYDFICAPHFKNTPPLHVVEQKEKCHYKVTWPTHYACPRSSVGNFFLKLLLWTIVFSILYLATRWAYNTQIHKTGYGLMSCPHINMLMQFTVFEKLVSIAWRKKLVGQVNAEDNFDSKFPMSKA